MKKTFYFVLFISLSLLSTGNTKDNFLPNIAELVEDTSSAVVNVSVIKTVKSQARHSPFPGSPRGFPFDDFFNFPSPFEDEPRREPEREVRSGGSGFIIS